MTKFELIFCLTVSIILAAVFLYCLWERTKEDAIAKTEAAAKLKGPIGFGPSLDKPSEA